MEKTFDSVAMMRELRDRLSREMAGMTPVERIRLVHEKAATTPLGALLQQLAGEKAHVARPRKVTKSQ